MFEVAHVCVACRPLASLNADYPAFQGHLGWRFGWLPERASSDLQPLAWNGQQARWACPDPAYEFPSMRPGPQPP